MKIRYFDHSATTAVDEKVLEAMLPYFTNNYGNPSSVYNIGVANKEDISIARMKVASILNCKVNEIYFTSCGSESDNLILKGIAFANKHLGNHIITTKIEHPAILNTCKFLENFGFKVTYLTPKPNGIIDLEELEKSITKKTILISVMYANNEIGTIQPIKEIGAIAKKYGIYFHTDAVQAIGNIKINVRDENIGALSLSAHKFYGPKGMGVAYINEKIPFIRIQDGGHQERNKRAGTENVPGIIGLSKAMELADKNLIEYNKKLKTLRDFYVTEVKKRIPYIRINGDMEKRLSGNSNICFSGVDGSRLLSELDKRGICASSGSACSAGLLTPSHVLLAIGVPKNIARSSLRITFGKENTLEDTKYLIDSVEEVVKNLRRK
jgi:cysteine desulfurase